MPSSASGVVCLIQQAKVSTTTSPFESVEIRRPCPKMKRNRRRCMLRNIACICFANADVAEHYNSVAVTVASNMMSRSFNDTKHNCWHRSMRLRSIIAHHPHRETKQPCCSINRKTAMLATKHVSAGGRVATPTTSAPRILAATSAGDGNDSKEA